LNIPSSIPYIIKKTALQCLVVEARPVRASTSTNKNNGRKDPLSFVQKSRPGFQSNTTDCSKSLIQKKPDRHKEDNIDTRIKEDRVNRFLPVLEKNVKQNVIASKVKQHNKSTEFRRGRKVTKSCKRTDIYKNGSKNIKSKS